MMPRQLQPCGTNAAYNRHVKAGQKPCIPCREAHAAYNRQRYEWTPAKPLKPCGTVAAYFRHLARKELTCQPCRDAHAKDAADRARRAKRAAFDGMSEAV